jgi:hypothetical protein
MKTSPFIGHIAEASPLKDIFPDGTCPLRGPLTRPAILGDAQEKADVYMLDLEACTLEQKAAIALFLWAKNPTMSQADASRFVSEAIEMPIRAINLTGCSFPHRLVS